MSMDPLLTWYRYVTKAREYFEHNQVPNIRKIPQQGQTLVSNISKKKSSSHKANTNTLNDIIWTLD